MKILMCCTTYVAPGKISAKFHYGQTDVLQLAAGRLAALSDGHISGQGDIVCPYHGWEFNGEGRCTHNPQVHIAGVAAPV